MVATEVDMEVAMEEDMVVDMEDTVVDTAVMVVAVTAVAGEEVLIARAGEEDIRYELMALLLIMEVSAVVSMFYTFVDGCHISFSWNASMK